MNYHNEREWTTSVGYDAVVVARSAGHRCGYVRIPVLHPAVFDPESIERLQVHGGVTFAERIEDNYVIGFDCAHIGDIRDQSIMGEDYKKYFLEELRGDMFGGTIKDTEFVVNQCEILAQQLFDLTENSSIKRLS